MGASLADLSERVRRAIKEPASNSGGGFIDGTDIRFWLNEAGREINVELEYLRDEDVLSSATPPGVATGYNGNALPTGILHKDALLWVTYDGVPLEIKTAEDIRNFPSTFWQPEITTGTPTHIYEWKGLHYLYPLIASSPLTLKRGFVKGWTDLVNPDDLSPLPDDLDRAMVVYGKWQGKFARGYADAAQAEAEYKQLLKRASNVHRTRQEPRVPDRVRPGGFGLRRSLWNGATIQEPQ